MERVIKEGDRIRCNGLVVTIKKIYYQFDGGEGDLMCEFDDTSGVHRYWKQQFDGGEFIQ